MKKQMQDKCESKIALNEKLSNIDAIIRQKALEDEEVLKAAGLYDYLDNDYGYNLDDYLFVQMMDCYLSLVDWDGCQNKEHANENLTKEEKIKKYKGVYEDADMFAKALKDYCIHKIIKG
jgi:hypothetical protein